MDGPGSTTLTVTSANEQTLKVDLEALEELVIKAAAEEGATGEISLRLVDVETMSRLNEEHMGVRGPTDVLAFPVDGLVGSASQVPVLVGEIVICPEYATSQTDDLGSELMLLAVHGTLHLLGFDHDTDAAAKKMREREFRFTGRAGARSR